MAAFSFHEDWKAVPGTPPVSAITIENICDTVCELIFSTAKPDNGTDGVEWDMYRLKPGASVRVIGHSGAQIPLWARCPDRSKWVQVDIHSRIAIDHADLKTIFPTGEGTA